MSDWRDQPASEKQIAYLKSQGIQVERGLTKGLASVLIAGGPTEGQLRRLSFYGIPVGPHLTKDEASDLIDDYVRDHPESEALYQEWKKKGKPAQNSCSQGCVFLILAGFIFLIYTCSGMTGIAKKPNRPTVSQGAPPAKRPDIGAPKAPSTGDPASRDELSVDQRVARDRKIEEDRVDAEKAAIASKEAWARINKSEADKKAEVYREDIDKEKFTKASSARALVKFPALGTANSSFNIQFVIRHKRYKDENPAFFNDPDWPMILARECDEFLKRR